MKKIGIGIIGLGNIGSRFYKEIISNKKEISVIGYLNNNFWNNKKTLQLVVRDIII